MIRTAEQCKPLKDATIVFDLDGTLVDTAPDLIRAANHSLAHYGFATVAPEIIYPAIGYGARGMISRALGSLGAMVDQPALEAMIDQFLTYYVAHISAHSRPFPGVIAALDGLRAEGARLAVCTNKREVPARKLLAELAMDRYFPAILGGDSLSVRKPDAGHLLATIARAGGDPGHAVMIGDSDADVDAARGAGVPVIAVSFGYHNQPVASLRPDRVLDHYRDLRPALDAVLG